MTYPRVIALNSSITISQDGSPVRVDEVQLCRACRYGQTPSIGVPAFPS